jgi:GntR family transcriptional regulator, transcriptional repressor for pyruvate dehydrogenase complex
VITYAPTTRAQALAAAIEKTIVDENLAAGAPLGTIEDWRTRSGFARATVSEALRLVVDRGIAEIRPGRGGGVFVSNTGPVVRLRHTLLSVHGEATTLADAIAIREALEPLIALDAARHRTSQNMTEVRQALAGIDDSMDDHDQFIRAVWFLHEAIARITPNEMLRAMYLAMLQVISERSQLATSDAIHEEGYRSHRALVHRELADAIESGDLERTSLAIEAHAMLETR